MHFTWMYNLQHFALNFDLDFLFTLQKIMGQYSFFFLFGNT